MQPLVPPQHLHQPPILLSEQLQLSCALLLMDECIVYSQQLQGQLWEIQAKLCSPSGPEMFHRRHL